MISADCATIKSRTVATTPAGGTAGKPTFAPTNTVVRLSFKIRQPQEHHPQQQLAETRQLRRLAGTISRRMTSVRCATASLPTTVTPPVAEIAGRRTLAPISINATRRWRTKHLRPWAQRRHRSTGRTFPAMTSVPCVAPWSRTISLQQVASTVGGCTSNPTDTFVCCRCHNNPRVWDSNQRGQHSLRQKQRRHPLTR